jgi:hypothetical protein
MPLKSTATSGSPIISTTSTIPSAGSSSSAPRWSDGVSVGKPRIVLVEYQFVYGSCANSRSGHRRAGLGRRLPGLPAHQRLLRALYRGGRGRGRGLDVDLVQPRRIPTAVGCRDPRSQDEFLLVERRGHDLDGNTALFSLFDPKFANRMQAADGTPGGSDIAATPPFLKLSFALTYCAPFAGRSHLLQPGPDIAPCYSAGEHDADRPVAGQVAPHDYPPRRCWPTRRACRWASTS